MVKNRHYVSLFIVLFLMVAGCAGKKKEIPTEEIRARADRAFDDLRAEESGGSKALPQENKGSELKPPVQPVKKNSDNVQVKKGARPDWVDGNSSQYPSSGYLTGVGYDSERELAENKARTEIAKIFLSRIESKTKSYQSYLQVSSKGKLDIEENLSIQDITEVSTQMVLSGVRIVQVYQETKPESLFYALAVLDREQSMNILTDKIRELDMDIKDFLLRAEAEKDMLARVKYLKQAVRKHVMREAYDAELRIVNGIGTGISPPISFTEIKSRLESVLFRDFLIGVSVIGSRADEVQDALIQGLNQQGFSVSKDLDRANIVVRGTVEIKPLDRGISEWKYIQWRAHFDMVDQKGGSIFGSVDRTGRNGHLNLSQAENGAVRAIRKALTTEIADEMRGYVFSQ